MSNTRLNWGIISTGRIASEFAVDVAKSEFSRVVAVGSRTQSSAGKFAAAHGGAMRAHGSYEALLADAEVEAVYIGTPHPQHLEWALRAVAAGKHVLCEKPLGMNKSETVRMVSAARAKGVLFMEAFMYRCAPQTAKVVEIIRSGVLGKIGMVQAAFGFWKPFDAAGRQFSKELGGGGILDVGCYPVSFSRLIAGAADGKLFADPVEFHGLGQVHPQTGIDVYAGAVAKFANGTVAVLSTGVGLRQEVGVRIYGTGGWLHVPAPWHPARHGGQTSLWLHKQGVEQPEEIAVKSPLPLYAVEADVFAKAVAAGLKEVPEMSLDDTLGNQATLDRWLADVGVTY
ncbi:oxidoreductase [Nibricoccus aquaticus]|uniref:Oxidoreductase n=1 Tax=Nibricoccus aquaticus TaxID=2576891 RepID=A0A290QCA2_9BACT|nr:Gfo/Idh/MocA family oxidoreductase [Nibricoccus aquaticus]ATC63866.1 oxidoreductase [Nibricoccus aquaticus]